MIIEYLSPQHFTITPTGLQYRDSGLHLKELKTQALSEGGIRKSQSQEQRQKQVTRQVEALAPLVTKNIKHIPLLARSPYILTLKYFNPYYLAQDVQLWGKNYKACQTQQRGKKKKEPDLL